MESNLTLAHAVALIILIIILPIVSVLDLKTRIIDPVFVIILLSCGFGFSLIDGLLNNQILQYLLFPFLGAIVGGLFLLLAGLLGNFILKKETMGGGDIKLMAGVGSIIGWQKVLLADFAAFFIAAIICLLLIIGRRLKKDNYIPFAPFLSAGIYFVIFMPQKYIAVLIDFII
jgi:leader peptidase (prepilin peptidase)/N-methyltransferase